MVANPNYNGFRAIETVYNGVVYRSRLEARFAVLWDTLGVDHLYEAEGYETPYGRYLPDQWLPGVYMASRAVKGVLLEIKPEGWDEKLTVHRTERVALDDEGMEEYDIWQTNTEARLEYVAMQLGVGALFARGYDSDKSEWVQVAPKWDSPMALYSCPACQAVAFVARDPFSMRCPVCGQADYAGSQVRIAQAVYAAQRTRFW